MKSLESLILRITDITIKDVKDDREFKFEYAITPDNKFILAGYWDDDKKNNYTDDTVLYVFDIDYASPLLFKEIHDVSIKEVFEDHILNNWNVYEIFKTFANQYQTNNDWLHKHLHLIIEIEYYNHQGYYDQYPDVDVLFDMFGRLDDDYLIDDLEQYKIKS